MNKGSDILSLLEKIVPPNDFQHRNGFNNRPLIDRLSVNEREILNQELIEKLSNKVDFLIVETLGYMGSNDALPILYKCLKKHGCQ
jgi:hypothetical protein